MRLHVIVDPEGKVENKLPKDLCERYSIRASAIEVDDDLTFNQHERILGELIRMVLTKPEEV